MKVTRHLSGQACWMLACVAWFHSTGTLEAQWERASGAIVTPPRKGHREDQLTKSNRARTSTMKTTSGSSSSTPKEPTVRLSQLIQFALQQNPRLQQAALAIAAAQGRAQQAGLYPNPTVTITGEEIGPRGGIHTLPQVNVPIVTANKLRLNRAVALKDVDVANLSLLTQRYKLLTDVRKGYVAVLTLQQRIALLKRLVKLGEHSLKNAKDLEKGKLIAELDVVPFEVDLEQFRASLEAAKEQREAAWRQLLARIGARSARVVNLEGSLQQSLPQYSFEQARAFLVQSHPSILAARKGVERAQLAVRRAEARGVPNLRVGGGYQLNGNDKLNQATYNVQVPIPLFNRNQGNVRAAKAQLARAVYEIQVVENDLTRRLAAALGSYNSARKQAKRYRTALLPRAEKAYELSLKAFQGGEFQYLRVIQAQRRIAQARLQYLRLVSRAWLAASEISGLLLEEQWLMEK